MQNLANGFPGSEEIWQPCRFWENFGAAAHLQIDDLDKVAVVQCPYAVVVVCSRRRVGHGAGSDTFRIQIQTQKESSLNIFKKTTLIGGNGCPVGQREGLTILRHWSASGKNRHMQYT